jgi:hypothetical protein
MASSTAAASTAPAAPAVSGGQQLDALAQHLAARPGGGADDEAQRPAEGALQASETMATQHTFLQRALASLEALGSDLDAWRASLRQTEGAIAKSQG